MNRRPEIAEDDVRETPQALRRFAGHLHLAQRFGQRQLNLSRFRETHRGHPAVFEGQFRIADAL